MIKIYQEKANIEASPLWIFVEVWLLLSFFLFFGCGLWRRGTREFVSHISVVHCHCHFVQTACFWRAIIVKAHEDVGRCPLFY